MFFGIAIKVVNLFFSAHLFMGVTAALLYTYYSNLLNHQTDLSKCILVGLATTATYNMVQLIPCFKNGPTSLRLKFLWDHRKVTLFITILSLAIVCILSLELTFNSFLWMTHLFLISLFYENIIPSKFSLRKIPFLKPLIIAYIWGGSTVILPALSNHHVSLNSLFLYFCDCFFFIFSLTLLFDLRDKESDEKDGIKTLATIYPRRTTKVVSIIAYLISFFCTYSYTEIFTDFIFHFIIFILYLFVIYIITERSREYYFLGIIDGLVLLKALMQFL